MFYNPFQSDSINNSKTHSSHVEQGYLFTALAGQNPLCHEGIGLPTHRVALDR